MKNVQTRLVITLAAVVLVACSIAWMLVQPCIFVIYLLGDAPEDTDSFAFFVHRALEEEHDFFQPSPTYIVVSSESSQHRVAAPPSWRRIAINVSLSDPNAWLCAWGSVLPMISTVAAEDTVIFMTSAVRGPYTRTTPWTRMFARHVHAGAGAVTAVPSCSYPGAQPHLDVRAWALPGDVALAAVAQDAFTCHPAASVQHVESLIRTSGLGVGSVVDAVDEDGLCRAKVSLEQPSVFSPTAPFVLAARHTPRPKLRLRSHDEYHACGDSCVTCSVTNVCTRCLPGYISSTAGECVSACPAGEFGEVDVALSCSLECPNAPEATVENSAGGQGSCTSPRRCFVSCNVGFLKSSDHICQSGAWVVPTCIAIPSGSGVVRAAVTIGETLSTFEENVFEEGIAAVLGVTASDVSVVGVSSTSVGLRVVFDVFGTSSADASDRLSSGADDINDGFAGYGVTANLELLGDTNPFASTTGEEAPAEEDDGKVSFGARVGIFLVSVVVIFVAVCVGFAGVNYWGSKSKQEGAIKMKKVREPPTVPPRDDDTDEEAASSAPTGSPVPAAAAPPTSTARTAPAAPPSAAPAAPPTSAAPAAPPTSAAPAAPPSAAPAAPPTSAAPAAPSTIAAPAAPIGAAPATPTVAVSPPP